jgi:hypothetical protein
MLDLPEPGLYRTTQPLPGNEREFPASTLVFIGDNPKGGGRFVVKPGQNRHNRWYWGEPTTPLRSPTWGRTLRRLPAEGFYTIPETMEFENGGRWPKNAIVQLGYNQEGRGILFVAERHESKEENALRFSDRGTIITDAQLDNLVWAPIQPLKEN